MSDEIQAEASEVRPGQRIAKVMARAGVCSRREAEAWIAEGRVSVNGEVLQSPAFNVSETDNVRVDGKPLAAPERTRLFLFHKPRGLVTTARDPEGRNTVFAVLPPDLPRVVAIGRLDINTEGLLLLTNDGGLSRVLELPSTGWLRRYRVRAHGTIDQAALDQLAEGVTIDGVDYMGVEAKLDREQGSNAWLTLGLREGKNREIKKILEHLGLAVNRLIRVSFGPFELGDLPEGEVMEVRTRVLRDQLGVKLAKEANVDFDAPQTIAIEAPPPERQGERQRGERGPRETRGPKRAMPGRLIVERAGARNGSKGMLRHAARPRPRRRLSAGANMSRCCARKAPQTQRPRASASSAARPTTARGGPSRSSACRGLSKRRPPPPRRGRNAAARPNTGERGGRSFEGGARAGRSDSFGPKRGRAAGGRERPPRSDHTEGRGRPERSSAGRAEGGPRERRFDRPPARSDGDRRDGPPRARSAGDPARERKFDRPPGRSRPPAGEGRPPRSDDRSGPRSDFKSRPPRAGRARRRPAAESRSRHGRRVATPPPRERRFDRPEAKRDGDRRERPPSTRGAGDPARERKFDRPQGRTRPPAGEGRPPRSDDKSVARAQTSNQDRRAQGRVTEIGRKPAAARAAKADRRAVAPHHRGGALPRGKDRRKAPAARAGRRESRDRCESSAAASRAARC